jgi:phosphatidylserine decarboxylase
MFESHCVFIVLNARFMIPYIDRKTNALCQEKIYGGRALSCLYGDRFWSKILHYTVLPLLACLPFFSRFYGFLQKRPSSRAKIKPFIQTYGIDTSEFESQDFRSFNDFFIRKLKPSSRPIVANPNVAVMPADGRYLVYPQFEQFSVKGQSFDLAEFLNDSFYARRFRTGSLVIARLCPIDYHRFHFPCDGTASPARLINGPLYSVNPLALRKRLAILSENKRMITEIESELFGTILYVEIGATAVGTIQQTFNPEEKVSKGQEKGFFQFGGSCLALLFEENRIVFDADLIANTQRGFETLAKFGESLGIAKE